MVQFGSTVQAVGPMFPRSKPYICLSNIGNQSSAISGNVIQMYLSETKCKNFKKTIAGWV